MLFQLKLHLFSMVRFVTFLHNKRDFSKISFDGLECSMRFD